MNQNFFENVSFWRKEKILSVLYRHSHLYGRFWDENKTEFKREVSFRYCTLGLRVAEESPGCFILRFLRNFYGSYEPAAWKIFQLLRCKEMKDVWSFIKPHIYHFYCYSKCNMFCCFYKIRNLVHRTCITSCVAVSSNPSTIFFFFSKLLWGNAIDYRYFVATTNYHVTCNRFDRKSRSEKSFFNNNI